MCNMKYPIWTLPWVWVCVHAYSDNFVRYDDIIELLVKIFTYHILSVYLIILLNLVHDNNEKMFEATNEAWFREKWRCLSIVGAR